LPVVRPVPDPPVVVAVNRRALAILAVLAVGGYLTVARWKALHPGPGAPRVTGPRFDLTWWR